MLPFRAAVADGVKRHRISSGASDRSGSADDFPRPTKSSYIAAPPQREKMHEAALCAAAICEVGDFSRRDAVERRTPKIPTFRAPHITMDVLIWNWEQPEASAATAAYVDRPLHR
jgi:hypothetical protein